MTIRVFGITEGGKYSLIHLAASAFCVLLGLDGTIYPMLVAGFPLFYIVWIPTIFFLHMRFELDPVPGLVLLIVMMIANSYLCGHTVAKVSTVIWRRASAHQ